MGDQYVNSEVKYLFFNKLFFYLFIGVKYMKRMRRIWNCFDFFDFVFVKFIILFMNFICFWKYFWKYFYDFNFIVSEDKFLYEFF